jgi:hypothetical protein
MPFDAIAAGRVLEQVMSQKAGELRQTNQALLAFKIKLLIGEAENKIQHMMRMEEQTNTANIQGRWNYLQKLLEGQQKMALEEIKAQAPEAPKFQTEWRGGKQYQVRYEKGAESGAEAIPTEEEPGLTPAQKLSAELEPLEDRLTQLQKKKEQFIVQPEFIPGQEAKRGYGILGGAREARPDTTVTHIFKQGVFPSGLEDPTGAPVYKPGYLEMQPGYADTLQQIESEIESVQIEMAQIKKKYGIDIQASSDILEFLDLR